MSEYQRHAKILEYLEIHKFLTFTELTNLLNISLATARRDVDKLHNANKAIKVKLGIAKIDKHKPSNKIKDRFALKLETHKREKQKIAAAAVELCDAYDTVILTSGSTMFYLGKQIAKANKHIQVITNFIPLANDLIENEYEKLVILGGQYNKEQAITIAEKNNTLNFYSANILFTSARGLSEEGLYKNDIIISIAEKEMLSRVNKLIVLIDSSKIGKKNGAIFCELSKIDTIITDKKIDPTMLQYLRNLKINVILV